MRINKYYAVIGLIAGTCGGLLSPVAWAAGSESVDLTLSGTISMGSCVPVFDNSTVDYGTISAPALDDSSPNDLGTKSVNFTVTCDTARSVGFTVSDNASSSAMTTDLGAVLAGNAFGLGQTAGGINLGSYTIALQNVTLDGTPGDVITSADGATWQGASADGIITNDGTAQWSAAASGADDAQSPAKIFAYQVAVHAVLQDAATLAITDETTMAGSSTFTLVYN